MKKTKFIACSLVVAAMLTGAGYAAKWTETITINNTAETGDLRIEWVNEGIYPYVGDYEQYIAADGTIKSRQSDLVQSEIIHGPKITTVNINNMFPGTWGLFEAKAKNLGTIPGKGTTIDVIFSDDSSAYLKEKILVVGKIFHYRPNPNGTATMVNSASIWNVPLKDLGSALSDQISGWELKPGEFLTFDVDDEFRNQIANLIPGYDVSTQNSLYYYLPMDADNRAENQNVQFTIHLNFKQFNM